MLQDSVNDARHPGDGSGNDEAVGAEMGEAVTPEHASDKEAREQNGAKTHGAPVHRLPAGRQAEGDAEIRDHARHVRGADDGAAVTGRHRILQAARHSREVVGHDRAVAEKVRCGDHRSDSQVSATP